jgi:hypothetical protein
LRPLRIGGVIGERRVEGWKNGGVEEWKYGRTEEFGVVE